MMSVCLEGPWTARSPAVFPVDCFWQLASGGQVCGQRE